MLLNVLIQSNFSAPANGSLVLTIDSTQLIQDLIDKFCEAKQIPVSPAYTLMNRHRDVLLGNKPLSYYGIESGEQVILCRDDTYQTYRFQNWNTVGILAGLLSLIGIISCSCVFFLIRSVPDNYAVVFDAGSTKTDGFLYKWPGSKVNNTGTVVQMGQCKLKGGLAEIRPENVSEYLSPCFNELVKSIPTTSTSNAEIFFGATAGMRVLREKNETAAAEIMSEVQKFFHSSELIFEGSHAEVISGPKEGSTGWITVNYLNNQLLKQNDSTWGALDLGGASTQISFQLKESINTTAAIIPVLVFGREVKVFSQSYLCYGTVQAMARYRAYLVLKHQEKHISRTNISSPCEHSGFELELPESQIFESPCVPKNRSTKGIMSQGFDQDQVKYTFVGSSDEKQCQATLQYLLSTKFCEEMRLEDCISIEMIPKGFQQNTYMGFSAYGFITEYLPLRNATKSEFKEFINHRCSMSLQTLVLEYINNDEKPEMSLKSLQSLCFKAMYMYTLLADVYQFQSEEEWSNLNFGTVIDGKDVGWALGFMVNATEAIASAPSVPGINIIVFVLLMVLFLAFLTLSIAFIIHAMRLRKSKTANNYRTLRTMA